MRLTEGESKAIVSCIRSLDAAAEIYLYGSRLDDSARGGDIDLLVISGRLGFSEKITLLVEIKLQIGDQRIDLTIVRPDERSTHPLARAVLAGAKRLD